MDFESEPVDAWLTRPGDEGFLRVSFETGTELGPGRALVLRAAGWDTTRAGNEDVELICRLIEPVVVDAATTISWTWWIGDSDNNDGAVLGLITRDTPGQLVWMSHSNRMRGWLRDPDPERQIVHHVERLGDASYWQGNQPPPEPWLLTEVRLCLVFPTDQYLVIDDIRIGPATDAPHRESTERVAAPMNPKATSLLAVDLDGDGDCDWLTGQAGQPPLVSLASGGLRHQRLEGRELGLGDAVSLDSPGVGDFDQDGVLDLVGRDRNRLLVFRGLGGGRFRAVDAPAVHPFLWRHGCVEAGKVHLAHLSAARTPCLVVHRVASIAHDSLFTWSRDGWSGTPFPEPGFDVKNAEFRRDAAVADLDGDLDLDLYGCNSDVLLQVDGRLCYRTEDWLPRRGNHQTGVACGDVDSDGDIDLVVTVDIRTHRHVDPLPSHRRLLLYRNEGGRFLEEPDALPGEATAHTLCPLLVDFDLDGDLDFFCCRDHRWEPPSRSNPKANLYLENDGTGRFHRPLPDSWLVQSPPAAQAVDLDADGDGDPDLLIMQWEDRQTSILINPAVPSHAPIVLRVPDRRGLPHAGGAHVAMRDGEGLLIAYRQTGVGSTAPGVPEIPLGCPGPGPYRVAVTFPSAPDRPVDCHALQPGRTLTIPEPQWDGPGGVTASRLLLALRRWVRAAAGLAWPFLLAIGLVGGVVGGWLVEMRRRCPGCLRLRDPRDRILISGASALVIIAAFVVGHWPAYETARLGAMAAVAGWASGCGAVFLGSYLDATRRREVLRSESVESGYAALIDAIDGFSHAGWLKYLSGLGSLACSLREGGCVETVVPRMRERLSSYHTFIRPQLHTIARRLNAAGLAEKRSPMVRLRKAPPSLDSRSETTDLGRSFARDVDSIDRAIANVDLLSGKPPADADLAALTEVVSRMHRTVDELFHVIGRTFRADVASLIEHTASRLREEMPSVELEAALPADLPAVFASPSELANILENLLRNGSRAAREASRLRPQRVAITARVEGKMVVILIHDTGLGIPEALRPTLFSDEAAGAGDHGRGLPYAVRRARKMDGRIGISSSGLAEGTTVSLSLRHLARPVLGHGTKSALGASGEPTEARRGDPCHEYVASQAADDSAGRR